MLNMVHSLAGLKKTL